MAMHIHGLSMDLHGLSMDCPWVSIDYLWISMSIHEYQWIPMDIHGNPLISMDIHGYPWIPINIGYPRISMGVNEFPLTFMDIREHLEKSTDFLLYLLMLIEFYGFRWIAMEVQAKSLKSVDLRLDSRLPIDF